MKYLTTKNIIIAVLILLVLFLLTCGHSRSGGFFQCNGKDTISHRIDTIIVIHKSDTTYIPQPVEVFMPGQVKWFEKTVHDTLPPITSYEFALPCDSQYTKAYFLTSIYKAHNEGKNWKVDIADTVTQNRIIGRGLKVVTQDTVIRESTTLLKHKLILYFGFSVQGGMSDWFHAAGLDLSLKGTNDRIYSIGANLTRDNKIFYQAGVRLPIRFHK